MIDWLLSTVWYVSALSVAFGALGLLKRVRWIGLTSRRRAGMVLLIATSALLANGLITPSPRSPASTAMAIDRFTPTFHFRESHSRSIDRSPAQVLSAIKGVTAGEISLFQAFTAIRRLGRSGPESILNAPDNQPILDVATKSGFLRLSETDSEVVVGAIVAAPNGFRVQRSAISAEWFQSLADPGIVKATMNFFVAPEGPNGTRLTTETRVFATDQSGARRFTPYWRTIFPGSWILRVTWLNAIKRRAEGNRPG